MLNNYSAKGDKNLDLTVRELLLSTSSPVSARGANLIHRLGKLTFRLDSKYCSFFKKCICSGVFAHVCRHMCVQAHVCSGTCVFRHVCVQAHVCSGACAFVCSTTLPPLLLRWGLLLGLELGQWPASPTDPLVSSPHGAGLIGLCVDSQIFFCVGSEI